MKMKEFKVEIDYNPNDMHFGQDDMTIKIQGQSYGALTLLCRLMEKEANAILSDHPVGIAYGALVTELSKKMNEVLDYENKA